jgi:UDP-N-acetylglucosamine--N-acetylmuramyl-(pentapeptide) pyrophosphoryl-undecaprenol N-acetylglucosamine transferase
MSTPTRPLRVIIACGGTGGHLFPGIAVAQVLRARGHRVLLLISEKQVDATAASDHPELDFAAVPAIGLPRLPSLRALPFAWKFWRTYRATLKILRGFQADAVLGMGGFTSFPPALAGRRLGARTFVHESNAIPGKANRLTARFSDVVLLGLAECAAHFPGKETRVVGTPLRAAMLAPVDRATAYAFFGLDPAKKTLLVMGGSQGARGVNRALLAALPTLDRATVQLLWLTGREDEGEVRAGVAASGHQALVVPFHSRLELAYAIADVCLARSGASSLAELAHFGVATILIPLPTAAEDHQTKNALVYARREAAVHLPQAEATAEVLGGLVRELLADDARRRALAARLHAMGVSDAAEQVATVVETSARTARSA